MSLETSAAAGPQDTTGGFDTVVAVTDGAARIADSTTLLHGSYSRLGQDLLIEAPDGTRTLVTDFFQAGRPTADLTGPGGETLSGALVARLAGPAPVAVAQASGAGPAPSAGEAIGVVTKIDGEVFVVRGDGTRVALQSGSQVFKGDVLQTGADGAVGITFVDNTELSLGNGGRLVLDEMIFDPDSGQGESSFSLVSGVFSFVSGQIAKTGPDAMQVQTPVATIGIRGTKGVIKVAEGDDVLDGERPVSMEIALLDSGEIVVRTLNGQMQTLNTVNTGLQVSNQAAADALFGGGNTLRLFVVDADYVASNPDVGRTLNFLPSAQPGQYDTPAGFNLGAVDGPVDGPQNNQQQGGLQQQQTGFDTLGRLDNPFSDGNSTIRVSLDAGQLREILGARLDVGEKDLANVVSVLELMAPVRTDAVVVATLTTPTPGGTTTSTPTTTPTTTPPTTVDPVTPTPPTGGTPITGGDGGTPVPPPVVVTPTPTTPTPPTLPPVVTPNPTPGGSGGGGGGGGGSTVTVAGRVVDPYVFSARVFIDEDGDGVWDPTEAFTYTDAEGRYSLSTTGTSGRIVSEGGIDMLTGSALNFTMSAPVGASAVTPLTTLMQALMSSNPGLTAAAAQSQVLGMVGLTTADIGGLDLTTANPLALLSGATAEAGAKLLAAGIKVANVISMVAAIRGDGDPAAASTAIADAVVASGGSSGLFDTGLTTLLGNAGVDAGDVASVATVLTNLNTAVDTALSNAAGDPAAALTGVVQVAIVAQSEAASTVASAIAAGTLASTVSSFVAALETKIADASPFVTLTGSSVTGSDSASSYILIGTGGNDSLTGNARADRLFGAEGNDLLTAGAGNDLLDAGAGDDTLVGGNGSDSLQGGAGNDVLRPFGPDTSPGSVDAVDGGEGLDTLDLSGYGTAVEIRLSTYDYHSEQLVGEVTQFGTTIATLSNVEAAVGTTGNDTLVGLGADEDMLVDLPTAVDDTLDGGAGNDRYYLTAGNDEIVRGTGDDTIVATVAMDLKFNSEEEYEPTAIGIEIQGASRSGDDLLLATYSHDRGTAYTVTVSGAYAADPADELTIVTLWSEVNESYSLLTYDLSDSTIYLTSNTDQGQLVVGRSGDDLIVEGGEGSGGDGDDLIYAGDGDDEVRAGLGDDVIYGGAGNDILVGGPGADTIAGDYDTIYAGDGDDVLWYDPDDVLDGGDGFDLLEVHDGFSGGSSLAASDLALLFEYDITDIEGLLLDSAGAMTLTLEADDVAAMATDGVLYIRGDADDTIDGTEAWSLASGTTTIGGVAYKTLTQDYQGETLTLRVEDGIDVTALTGADDTVGGGSAESLAAQLLGGLTGITVTGATLQGNDTSGQQSYGSFSGLTMGGVHSLSAGIALASGSNPLDNANTTGSTGTLASGQGNALLDAIPNIGTTTDATVLTVTFTVDSGIEGLSFRWMYGTEEAPEQSVTDIAGVFLNGTNLLFMPDGETPVAWYNGNTTQTAAYTLNSGQLATEYDSVISPQDLFVPLTAGTHTLTFAVSDTSDTGFDSALFIAFNELVGTVTPLAVVEDEGGGEPTVGTDGDDTFYVSSTDFPSIDGGAGLDTLYIDGDLDFTQLGEGQVASIERLVLDQGSDAITLDAAAVAQLLSGSDTSELTIEVQDATPDNVMLSEDFLAVDGEAPEGYTSYSNGSHTVTIVDHNAPSQPLAA